MADVEVLIPQDVEQESPGKVAQVDERIRVHVVEEDGTNTATAPRALLLGGLSGEATRRVLGEHPSVEWVHSFAAGVEHLLPRLGDYKGLVTNSAGVHGEPIAEWVIMMLLAHSKQLPRLLEHHRSQEWESERGEELGGKTLGIVGAGGIGGAIARRARGLDIEVIGTRTSGEPTEHIATMYTPDQLHEMLPDCDFVVIATPLTSQTTGLIGEPELRVMRDSAAILNIARGKVIQTDALLRALTEGWIAGAYLDVTDPEPLPADHPLWTAPGAIITAHTSGHSPRSTGRVIDFFCQNLRLWLDSAPLQNVVDREREY
ncbi:MAG: D-2-hydroxyacid dehydrogenase [Chloroflexota bacterium]|nr:D-2-hydroxyacid dehydrogenase [Chloroflexota bacterium]